jgi:D-alanyl-D-alanine carboxypeptidase/D-alanyl-D-alanine-endopeptidase (penicillin-binding protein 4)
MTSFVPAFAPSRAAGLLSLVLCISIWFPPPAPAQDGLSDRIDQVLRTSRADPVFWGVSVRDVESGQVLYERNADHAFLPASNQKLLTAATALDALSSTHRYETTLHFDGAVTDSVMSGDLIIKGSGDPSFGSTEVRGDDPLRVWAEQLAAMGVRRIEGRLIGDDDAFDDRPYPEGWDIDYITRQASRSMGASTSGLSYNDNVVIVQVRATRPGAPPSVQTIPDGVLTVNNEATTSSRRYGAGVRVARAFESNAVNVIGSVPRYYRGSVVVPVANPTMLTVQSFHQALQEAGIETDLALADVDDLPSKPNTSSITPLFVELSPPLADLLAVMNKESNNLYAEQIFRTYGWAGSVRGGANRTERFMRRAGVNTRDILVRDGSGLSRKDLITPEAMVQMLIHMDAHRERAAFLSSLPLGGERGSTLEYRLRNRPVRAKTGSLRFIRSLSGYATRPDGRRVAFALFANNYTGPSYRVTNAFDEVVAILTASSVS